MKHLIPIFFTILVLIIPSACSAATIAAMEGDWELSGEITNTNPYTVFVVVPDSGDLSDKSLKSSDDFVMVSPENSLNESESPLTADNDTSLVIMNGKKGFWLPPYTTKKIKLKGKYGSTFSVDDSQSNYDISGPALVSSTKLIDLKTILPIYKKGVKLNEFKLWVTGNISKSEDTDVLSIIIPAPVVLNNYYKFNKVLGQYDKDVWIDSYNDYVTKHKEISYKQNPELYEIDDTLIPNMDDDLGMDVKLKIFDVPAMVFTTTSSESIDFAYTMYWDENYN
jgi:hypothetical protein